MRRFISTILVMLLLLGNLGFVLNTHLCDGMMAETSINYGSGADGCDMTKSKATCDDAAEPVQSLAQEACCIDIVEILQAFDAGLAKSIHENNIEQFYVVLHQPVLQLQNIFSEKVVPHSIFHPPAQKQEIPILIQSFLI